MDVSQPAGRRNRRTGQAGCGHGIPLAASPTYGTQLQLRAGGNARTKTYNYDAITGKWVCTTTNTADTAQPDPCTLLLRAKH